MNTNKEIQLFFNKSELAALANVVLHANSNLFNSNMQDLQFLTITEIFVSIYKRIQIKRQKEIKSVVQSLKLNIQEMWAFVNIFKGTSKNYAPYEAIILDKVLAEIHRFQVNNKHQNL